MKKNYKLKSRDHLTAKIKQSGIETWHELLEFTKKLPYGRNANRMDLELVFSEKKGTCSSKHAFLKKVADLNKIKNIKLIIGIYRMTQKNTPKIGTQLCENSIEFIPEAHCYLKINNLRTDLTTKQSDINKIESDIIHELEIIPEQVAAFKVDYHKAFLKNWISESRLEKSFDEIWQIREKCIENLTETPIHNNLYTSKQISCLS